MRHLQEYVLRGNQCEGSHPTKWIEAFHLRRLVAASFSIRSDLLARVLGITRDPMIPEPYELFDINKGADKLFLIGTSWVVLFLFLL